MRHNLFAPDPRRPWCPRTTNLPAQYEPRFHWRNPFTSPRDLAKAKTFLRELGGMRVKITVAPPTALASWRTTKCPR